MKAQPNHWIFLTADRKSYADRVAAEFLGLFVQGSDHATDLAVVDRWGKVRQKFNWRDPSQELAMLKLLAQSEVSLVRGARTYTTDEVRNIILRHGLADSR